MVTIDINWVSDGVECNGNEEVDGDSNKALATRVAGKRRRRQ